MYNLSEPQFLHQIWVKCQSLSSRNNKNEETAAPQVKLAATNCPLHAPKQTQKMIYLQQAGEYSFAILYLELGSTNSIF